MTAIDLSVLDFIQAHLRTGFGDFIMPIITLLGEFYVYASLVILLLCFKKTRALGIFFACALLVNVTIVNFIVKPLVARVRPYDINTAVSLLIKKPSGFSFPSGHASAAFAIVTVLFCRKNKFRFAALALSLLVVFSRIYLYVHFPSDIIGGIVFGVIAGILGYLIARQIISRFGKRLGI